MFPEAKIFRFYTTDGQIYSDPKHLFTSTAPQTYKTQDIPFS